jgi:hypothetical protein
LVVVVVVLSIVAHVTVLVHVILQGLLIHFKPAAFQCFLQIELAVVLVVLVVSAVLILATVIESLKEMRAKTILDESVSDLKN